MTLNGVIALILRYFTEFDSFEGRLAYITVVEEFAVQKYRLLFLAKIDPPCSAVSLR